MTIDSKSTAYSTRPRKADATGRSASPLKMGQTKRWKAETPFIAISLAMLQSVAYRSLSLPARRVLDFLIREHLMHGGSANGDLAATYTQIQIEGTSKRDVPKAFAMLKAFGFIERMDSGGMRGGRMNMARYRLTFTPDQHGRLPTDEWRRITIADVTAFRNDPKIALR